jgi:transitional endoplasmic reticulum ATPase
MDGIEELRGVVVMAATSRPDLLDPSLVRAGRFEVQLELPMPDEAGRRAIFAIHTASKPLAKDVDLDKLAKTTDGYAGADIEAVCRRASMESIREFLETNGADADSSEMKITARHFADALDAVYTRDKGLA